MRFIRFGMNNAPLQRGFNFETRLKSGLFWFWSIMNGEKSSSLGIKASKVSWSCFWAFPQNYQSLNIHFKLNSCAVCRYTAAANAVTGENKWNRRLSSLISFVYTDLVKIIWTYLEFAPQKELNKWLCDLERANTFFWNGVNSVCYSIRKDKAVPWGAPTVTPRREGKTAKDRKEKREKRRKKREVVPRGLCRWS